MKAIHLFFSTGMYSTQLFINLTLSTKHLPTNEGVFLQFSKSLRKILKKQKNDILNDKTITNAQF